MGTLLAERRPKQWPELAERLAAARKAAGLTQEQLAERLDVRQGFVANVEAATHRPKAEEVWRWAYQLGLPLGELLILAGYVPDGASIPEPDRRSPRVRRFESLSDDLQRRALRFIDLFLEERPAEGEAPQRADDDEGE